MVTYLYVKYWVIVLYNFIKFRINIYKYKKLINTNVNCDMLLKEMMSMVLATPIILPLPKEDLLRLIDVKIFLNYSNINVFLSRIRSIVSSLRYDGSITAGGFDVGYNTEKAAIDWFYPKSKDIDITLYGHYSDVNEAVLSFIEEVKNNRISDEFLFSRTRSIYHGYFRFLIVILDM